jgi:hypothetical protein
MVDKEKPAGAIRRVFCFQASTEDYSALRFFRAAPRMSPSEAPESDEPN